MSQPEGVGQEPDRVLPLRRIVPVIAAALRLASAAAPREFAVVVGLQAVAGLGLVVPILAGRDLLHKLLAQGTSGEAAPLLLQGALVVCLLGAINLAAAVAAGRDDILRELLTRYVIRRLLDVAGTTDLERFESPDFHDRLERASRSAVVRPHQLAQGLGALLNASLATTGVTIALVAIEPILAAVTLLAVVPLWIAGVRSGRVVFAMLYRLTSAERERGYLVDLLTRRDPVREVRAYGLAPFLRGRWERRTGERLREVGRAVRTRLRITLVARIFSGLVVGAVLALLVLLVSTGRTGVADAGAAAGAVLLLAARLRAAAMGTDLLFEAAPFIDDLRGFVALAAGAATRPRPPATRFRRLTVEGLEFTYPSADRRALRGVDIEINAGEVVALVGENGSGKTTLAKLLCHLYQPQRGRIRYDGHDVTGTDPDALRDSIAVVFQDFQRYLLTAGDNIGAGRWQRIDDRAAVRAAAAAAGTDGFLADLPEGYHTLLGPEFAGGTDLSGGQWQRLALARAFFRDAPFVILDEPSATLDARAEHALFERIRELLVGRTVLLISHRFSTVRSADRIYVLADGRIVEHGSHSQLVALGGRYAEMFALQASPYLDAAGTTP